MVIFFDSAPTSTTWFSALALILSLTHVIIAAKHIPIPCFHNPSDRSTIIRLVPWPTFL
jgi:hypothetical protein